MVSLSFPHRRHDWMVSVLSLDRVCRARWSSFHQVFSSFGVVRKVPLDFHISFHGMGKASFPARRCSQTVSAFGGAEALLVPLVRRCVNSLVRRLIVSSERWWHSSESPHLQPQSSGKVSASRPITGR